MKENKKTFSIFEIFNLRNLISFIIIGIISTAGFFIMYFVYEKTIKATVDGLFIGFVLALTACLLNLLNYFGTFDLVAVGFSNMINVHFRKDFDAKYDSVVDYTEAHKIKRKTNRLGFTSYLFVAIIYLIIFIIYYNLYYLPIIPK